jgi:hypothetical protein
MTIREKIGKLPVWKVAITLCLILTFLIAGIEEIFISRVFSFADRMITVFEKEKKEDMNEIDRDYQAFNERQEYDQAEYNITGFDLKSPIGLPQQDYVCHYAIMNKKLEKLYQLAYVKKNIEIRQYITHRIANNKKLIDEEIKKGQFNSSACKDYSS